MIEVKNGRCKMRGDVNEIFTDVVQAVCLFCEGLAEVNDADVTGMLYCVVAAAAEQSESVDMDKLIEALKKKDALEKLREQVRFFLEWAKKEGKLPAP